MRVKLGSLLEIFIIFNVLMEEFLEMTIGKRRMIIKFLCVDVKYQVESDQIYFSTKIKNSIPNDLTDNNKNSTCSSILSNIIYPFKNKAQGLLFYSLVLQQDSRLLLNRNSGGCKVIGLMFHV